ncbi:MAG: nucleoside-diphosphate kinase [Bacteroidetes bacterium]|nr:nucleoside-diphosphate kinase [Bacteroidota bacterium]
MAGNRTFTMIKPSAMATGHAGDILAMMEKAGFRLIAMRLVHLSRHQAGIFYAEHSAKGFYEELTRFMSSGPIIAAILEKDNAVAEFRKLIGATDPAKADPGTVRSLYGKSITENAVHGSDADSTAEREGAFFFSQLDRV